MFLIGLGIIGYGIVGIVNPEGVFNFERYFF